MYYGEDWYATVHSDGLLNTLYQARRNDKLKEFYTYVHNQPNARFRVPELMWLAQEHQLMEVLHVFYASPHNKVTWWMMISDAMDNNDVDMACNVLELCTPADTFESHHCAAKGINNYEDVLAWLGNNSILRRHHEMHQTYV